MTKIKNFRITLRCREIARTLKNHDQLQITPALEASIEHLAKEAKAFLAPAALYTTLTRAIAEKATSLALPREAIAVSVIAVTLGAGIESELAAADDHSDPLQKALLLAVRQEGLAQATHFALRLIQDQAKDEDCELSAPWPVTEGPLLPSLMTLLGAQRIGLTMDDEHSPVPDYARLMWTAWSPIPKRATRRAEAPPRAQKAAV